MQLTAYIPIAIRQLIDETLTKELHEISLLLSKYTKYTIILPIIDYYERGDNMRYKAIAKASKKCFDFAIAKNDKYFIMCNSNKVQKEIKRIPELIKYLDENDKCGLVAYAKTPTKKNPRHVQVGFCVIRTKSIENITYNMSNANGCNCMKLCGELRLNGWEVSYIGDQVFK